MPLPAKETQPMIALSRTASVTPKVSESTAARDRNSSMETSAAAPPPTPLNSATICGMAVLLSAIIGCVSFAGSGITFAKLQELMSGRPFAPPWLRYVFGGLVAVLLVLVVVILATESVAALIVLALLALVFGVLFVLPVGGADVPIVISLLNAFLSLIHISEPT